MHHSLRLADREGLLTGQGLGPVQHFAVVLLEYIERVDKVKRDDRELRLGLLAAGIAPDILFPEPEDEVFPDETEQVIYKFDPNQELDPQSIEEELRWLAAEAANGTASFEDGVW